MTGSNIQRLCRFFSVALLCVAFHAYAAAETPIPTADNLSITVSTSAIEISWVPVELDNASELIGYLVRIWDKEPPRLKPIWNLTGKASQVLFTANTRIGISNLKPAKDYFVAVTYVLKKNGLKNNDTDNDLQVSEPNWLPGGSRWTGCFSVPKKISIQKYPKETESRDIKVKLSDLYDNPDSFVGKLIEVEGYFNLFHGAKFKGDPNTLPALGSSPTRSGGSITDGKVILFTVIDLSGWAIVDLRQAFNYVRTIGYLSASVAVKHPDSAYRERKPGYLFRPVEVVEFLNK